MNKFIVSLIGVVILIFSSIADAKGGFSSGGGSRGGFSSSRSSYTAPARSTSTPTRTVTTSRLQKQKKHGITAIRPNL